MSGSDAACMQGRSLATRSGPRSRKGRGRWRLSALVRARRPRQCLGASRRGAAAKVPSLWLYSLNDRFWGPRLPHQWFRSFVAAGGKAQFVQLPSFADDGHKSFAGNSTAWIPAFEAFLQEIGFLGAAPQAGR